MRKLIRLLILTAVLAVVGGVILLSASIYTFARLTDETMIAEVRFERIGADRYLAFLRTGDFCDEVAFEIQGDQWRIDAEFVKWHYWANLLGLDSQYRLDRFEGRYSNIERQNQATGNAHSLQPATALDIVALADSLGELNFMMDATYGSSTYLTIQSERIFEVYKSPTGIFARSRAMAPAPDGQQALAIEIRQACGNDPGTWERFTTWIDRSAVQLL